MPETISDLIPAELVHRMEQGGKDPVLRGLLIYLLADRLKAVGLDWPTPFPVPPPGSEPPNHIRLFLTLTQRFEAIADGGVAIDPSIEEFSQNWDHEASDFIRVCCTVLHDSSSSSPSQQQQQKEKCFDLLWYTESDQWVLDPMRLTVGRLVALFAFFRHLAAAEIRRGNRDVVVCAITWLSAFLEHFCPAFIATLNDARLQSIADLLEAMHMEP